MPFVFIVPTLLALGGLALMTNAVVCERRMQRHRAPGVSYWHATLRLDGGWRRTELFSPEGLQLQRRASRSALFAVTLWAWSALSYAALKFMA